MSMAASSSSFTVKPDAKPLAIFLAPTLAELQEIVPLSPSHLFSYRVVWTSDVTSDGANIDAG